MIIEHAQDQIKKERLFNSSLQVTQCAYFNHISSVEFLTCARPEEPVGRLEGYVRIISVIKIHFMHSNGSRHSPYRLAPHHERKLLILIKHR